MAETKIIAKICLRQGDNTYCESFDASTPQKTLLTGEPIFNTSTNVLKIGDGASAYNQLDSYYLGTEITGVAYNNGNLTITKKDSNGGDFGFITRIVNITKDQLADALKIELTNKANTSDVNTALAAKADKTYVDEELDTKANITDVNTALATKTDKTYVDEELDTKANSVDVNASINDANFSNGKLTLKKLDNTNKEISMNNFGETDVTITGRFQQGTGTNVTGNYAHAEGQATTASGAHSHAEGHSTVASHQGSHTEGYHTNTSANYQHVSGKYNADNSDALLIVGNGTDDSHRSNALEVFQDGKVKIGANPEESMEVTTKEYVDTSVQDAYLTKTLSGESIYIEDGANNVPVKMLSATVSATGAGTLTVRNYGVNLLDYLNGRSTITVLHKDGQYGNHRGYELHLSPGFYFLSAALKETGENFLVGIFNGATDKTLTNCWKATGAYPASINDLGGTLWVVDTTPVTANQAFKVKIDTGDVLQIYSAYEGAGGNARFDKVFTNIQVERGADVYPYPVTTPMQQFTEPITATINYDGDGTFDATEPPISRYGINNWMFDLPLPSGVTSATMSTTYYCDPTYVYEKNLNLIYSAYPTETQSNVASVVTDIGAENVPLKSLVVDVAAIQSGSGTPSADNVRPITGRTSLNVVVSPTVDPTDGTIYTVSLSGVAGGVYIGRLDVATGVLTIYAKKYTLNNSEYEKKFQNANLTYTGDGYIYMVYVSGTDSYSALRGTREWTRAYMMSNMFKYKFSTNQNALVAWEYGYAIGQNQNYFILPKEDQYSTVAKANTWLSTHPIDVVLALATHQVVQLSPTNVRSILGQMNVTCESSNIIQATYRLDPTLTYQKLQQEQNKNIPISNNVYTAINANNQIPIGSSGLYKSLNNSFYHYITVPFNTKWNDIIKSSYNFNIQIGSSQGSAISLLRDNNGIVEIYQSNDSSNYVKLQAFDPVQGIIIQDEISVNDLFIGANQNIEYQYTAN